VAAVLAEGAEGCGFAVGGELNLPRLGLRTASSDDESSSRSLLGGGAAVLLVSHVDQGDGGQVIERERVAPRYLALLATSHGSAIKCHLGDPLGGTSQERHVPGGDPLCQAGSLGPSWSWT